MHIDNLSGCNALCICGSKEPKTNFLTDSNFSLLPFEIRSNSGFSERGLFIKHETAHRFWIKVIQIEKLLPLEEIILFLSNDNENIP